MAVTWAALTALAQVLQLVPVVSFLEVLVLFQLAFGVVLAF